MTFTPEQKEAYAMAALRSVPISTPIYWRILKAIGRSNGQRGVMEISQ